MKCFADPSAENVGAGFLNSSFCIPSKVVCFFVRRCALNRCWEVCPAGEGLWASWQDQSHGIHSTQGDRAEWATLDLSFDQCIGYSNSFAEKSG